MKKLKQKIQGKLLDFKWKYLMLLLRFGKFRVRIWNKITFQNGFYFKIGTWETEYYGKSKPDWSQMQREL